MEFPLDYPFKSPNVHFNCKVYHPNVDESGGMSCIQSDG